MTSRLRSGRLSHRMTDFRLRCDTAYYSSVIRRHLSLDLTSRWIWGTEEMLSQH